MPKINLEKIAKAVNRRLALRRSGDKDTTYIGVDAIARVIRGHYVESHPVDQEILAELRFTPPRSTSADIEVASPS